MTTVPSDKTTDELLDEIRLALPFILRRGKRSMGREYGFLNPNLVVARALKELDDRMSKGCRCRTPGR